jgi:hypothetical protein
LLINRSIQKFSPLTPVGVLARSQFPEEEQQLLYDHSFRPFNSSISPRFPRSAGKSSGTENTWGDIQNLFLLKGEMVIDESIKARLGYTGTHDNSSPKESAAEEDPLDKEKGDSESEGGSEKVQNVADNVFNQKYTERGYVPFLDNEDLSEWDDFSVDEKRQITSYWHSIEVFLSKNPKWSVRDGQIALFMASGVFSHAQEILAADFDLNKLDAETRRNVFESEDDSAMLDHSWDKLRNVSLKAVKERLVFLGEPSSVGS